MRLILLIEIYLNDIEALNLVRAPGAISTGGSGSKRTEMGRGEHVAPYLVSSHIP